MSKMVERPCNIAGACQICGAGANENCRRQLKDFDGAVKSAYGSLRENYPSAAIAHALLAIGYALRDIRDELRRKGQG